MEAWLIVGGVIWIACGVLDYGLTVAYFQRQYASIAADAKSADRAFGVACGLFGPIALFATLIVCRPLRGWML